VTGAPANSTVSRFLVDDAALDDETALRVYGLLIGWAAERGTRYELTIQPGLSTNRELLDAILALGEVTPLPQPGGPVAKWLAAGHDVEARVVGSLMNRFAALMLDRRTDVIARSSELSSVEDARVYADERLIYELYDYGRTQLVSGDDAEIDALRRLLAKVGAGDVLTRMDETGAG
jgi:hypothetical protein